MTKCICDWHLVSRRLGMLLMILQYIRQPTITKNYLAQDINSATVEKPCSNTKAARFFIPTTHLGKFQKFSLFPVPNAANKKTLTFFYLKPFPYLSCLPLPIWSAKCQVTKLTCFLSQSAWPILTALVFPLNADSDYSM